jgi:hypothetical protein
MLTITVDIPDNPSALDELEASLRDGCLDDLREQFSWMAKIAESAIQVEVKQDGNTARNPRL